MQKGLINKSGAYAIKIDGIIRYVGSGVNLESRKSNHLARLRKGRHNKKLQELFDISGEENFEFVVLEYCNKSNTYTLEKKYMDKYKDTIVNKKKVVDTHKKLRRGLNSVEHKEKYSKMMQGIKNPNNKKLDIDDVIQVKEMLSAGVNQSTIAEKFDVSPTLISNIKNGTRWSCVQAFPI